MSSRNAQRIYKITDNTAENPAPPALVRAATKAQAIAAVVRERYSATVASQEELVSLVASGTAVIAAREEDAGE